MAGPTREDVRALLSQARRQMDELGELYEASLGRATVTPALRAQIKNVLENQRSSLEYVAHGIVAAHGTPNGRTYFPIVKQASDFPSSMKRNMRGVAQARPDIADSIERCQPYRPGREWLGHLATLTNENKHQQLTPQTRTEMTRIAPGAGGDGSFGLADGSQIQMTGGGSIEMSGGASIIFEGPGQPFQQNMTRAILVDWLFDRPQVSALGLLNHIQRELPLLLEALMDEADL